MNKGYFIIWRRLFDHPLWTQTTPEQKAILITLIGMANHSEKKWFWKGEEFTCKRGQIVTSLEEIANKSGPGITKQHVRTALQKLQKYNFLTNESTKSGRLITVENYSVWQIDKSEANKDANKDLTKTQQRPNKDLTPTNKLIMKECNNEIYKGVPLEIKESFMEWVDMRRQTGKPLLSERAVERALKTLNELSKRPDKQIKIIEQSVDRCWASFYPLKVEPTPPSHEAFKKDEPVKVAEMPQEIRDMITKLGGKQ